MIITLDQNKERSSQDTLWEATDLATEASVQSVWVNYSKATNLTETILDRARRISRNSYYSNFLYHKLINLIVDTILMTGFEFQADPESKEMVEEFWFKYPNRIDNNLRTWLIEYLIHGEMFWVFQRNRINNKVYVQTVSPTQITKVESSTADPRLIDKITVNSGDEEKTFKMLTYRPTTNSIEGNAFLFTYGNFGDQVRGVPPFIAILDLLNEFQTYAYAYLRGSAFRNSIWFKVVYAGATVEQLQDLERARGKYPPAPNSIITSNDRVEWDLLDPKVTSNADQQAQFLLDLLINSTEIPSFLFNGDIPNNLSTFSGLQEIISIQKRLASDFSTVVKMVTGDMDVECVPGQMVTKDVQRLSGSILRLINATLAAKENGQLTDDEARRIIAKVFDFIGIEVGND